MRLSTEDCKLVVTCKMQNRNATDKLNQQCSKLALLSYPQISIIAFANNANLLHCGFNLSVAFLFCIWQVTTNLQSSVPGSPPSLFNFFFQGSLGTRLQYSLNLSNRPPLTALRAKPVRIQAMSSALVPSNNYLSFLAGIPQVSGYTVWLLIFEGDLFSLFSRVHS